jgi:16S rRNA processing protein RimM
LLLTDFPQRFKRLHKIYLQLSGKPLLSLNLESFRFHKGMVLLKFEGINDRDAAQNLNNGFIQIPEAEIFPLPAGHYYQYQLLGVKAYSTEGDFLGQISEILPQSNHDIWVIKNNLKEILIPALKKFIRKVDLEAGMVSVKFPQEWRDED